MSNPFRNIKNKYCPLTKELCEGGDCVFCYDESFCEITTMSRNIERIADLIEEIGGDSAVATASLTRIADALERVANVIGGDDLPK